MLRHFGKTELGAPNSRGDNDSLCGGYPTGDKPGAGHRCNGEETHPQSLVMGRDLSEPQMPVGIVSASDIVREIGRDGF